MNANMDFEGTGFLKEFVETQSFEVFLRQRIQDYGAQRRDQHSEFAAASEKCFIEGY